MKKITHVKTFENFQNDENDDNKILKFHIGRGGRFNDSGYVTFVDFEEMSIDSVEFQELFPQYDENDEKVLDDYGNHIVNRPSGDPVDYEILGGGTGYLNIDHDYDTTIWVNEDDLTQSQISAVEREITNSSLHRDELERIIREYYS